MAVAAGDHLQVWVERLSQQPLPVLRSSLNALRHLVDRGSYNGGELTRQLAHDPLLCAQLLRLANSRSPEGRVATLEQAVVMCGEGTLEKLARSVPVLEDKLPEPLLLPLLQLYRFSFHVGYLARDLTRQKRDHHYDDAYFAGLLHGLGELLVRVFAPKKVPAIARLAADKGISRGEAARQLVGFELHELSLALAREWHLPGLLQSALDDDHFQDKRCQLVDLAVGMMRAGPRLILPDSEDPLVQRAAEVLSERASGVKGVIFRANAGAAEYLQIRMPGANSEVFVDFFPTEPDDSIKGEAALAGDPNPEALQGLKAAFQSTATESLTPHRVLELFTAAVREGLGLDRVVFALLTPDHAMLHGRFFGGVQANSALHRFEFERNGKTIFARLMDKPAAFWLNGANLRKMAPLLTEHVRRVIEVEEFFVHSIFIGDRPVGLCYADRALSRKPLSEVEYKEFRVNCQLLTRRLASLSGNK